MGISTTYRPTNVVASDSLRAQLDGWSAGSSSFGTVVNNCVLYGDVDDQGTAWHLNDIDGWLNAPTPRLSISKRPGEHGAFDGPAFLDTRVITLMGTATVQSRVAAHRARDIVESVCGDPSLGLQTLVISAASTPQRQALVRRSSETKTGIRGNGFVVDWSIILTAPDPRRYSTTLSSFDTGLPQVGSGGLVFPLVFPLTFGSSTSGGQLSITNSGTIATWPTWSILGPATGPIIANLTTGEQLAFDPTFTVPAGQTLVIDTDAKTVQLAGVNRRDRLFVAQWFRLPPGNTVIRFSAVSAFDPATKLTVQYREAWS